MGTMLLSVLGPVTYRNYNFFGVLLFIAFICIAIKFGFNIKSNRLLLFNSYNIQPINNLKNVRVVNKLVYFSLVLYSVLFARLIVTKGLDMGSIVDGLMDLGNIYKTYLHEEDNGVDALMQIVTFCSAVPFAAMCGGFYYFKNPGFNRKVFICFAVVNILEEVLTNAQFVTVANWFLAYIIVFFINYINKSGQALFKREIAKTKKYTLIITLIVASIFVFFQNSRAKTYDYQSSGINTEYFYSNSSHILYKLLPEGIADGVSFVDFYLTGGYYGLGKNLQTDFEWTYGYGNSKGLSSYLNQYLGFEDKFYNSYPLRTEKRTGYPNDLYWATVFSWLAGDLSFPGVIVFMCFLMYFYLRLYEKVVCNDDLPALLLFVRLTIFFLYIPATNLLMQTRGNVIITICLLLYYLFYSKPLFK